MAFGVESTNGGSKDGFSPGTTLTISHTVTAANLLLVGVGVGFDDVGTDPLTVLTGVTYNGVAMTAVSGSDSDDNSFEGCRWYSLASPATGTHDVVITVNNNDAQIGVGIIGFTDANTTLKTPSVATNTTANPSVTVVDTASGDIVVSALATDGSSGATTAGGTVFTNGDIEDINSDSDFNFQYQTASGANTNCTWTNSTTGSGWATSGLAVRAAGGGGAAAASTLMLMGMGP